ncbi:FAD-binding domain [Lysobacter silvisoli]|uniref:FAD-binding domain n=1 Tax=Lysobacter silvisoli TaxID=2293254 RepID=A0A371K2B2_9GAMM|nr:FAD-binding domain [Lysobacter silvisoli]RDZ28061.1 FAD-binding domain [Lysobacter silvisoli]
MKVVINGAGIAGTALAYWLGKQGHDVHLIEQAPAPRTGGYVLNLWGVGYDAAEKMGLLPRLQQLQYHSEHLRMVDRHGRTSGGYPPQVLLQLTRGRIATLARSDIAAAIHGLLDGRVHTHYGDSIASIEPDGPHVHVGFDRGPPLQADLVVGADGLHSRIRQLAFGQDARYEYPMGCHVAAFEVAGYRPREDGVYVAHSAPGRYIARFPVRGDKMLFFLLFRDEYLAGVVPTNDAERKAALKQVYADVGWECPAILSGLADTGSVYFDRVSQIRMDAWNRGRVALVGDAAACPSLIAGSGAGFAMAQAYVLAGELHEHPNDLERALSRYEARLKPFVARKQQAAEKMVPSFVPATGLGVRARDLATVLMRLPVCPRLLMGRYLNDEIALPAYAMEPPNPTH